MPTPRQLVKLEGYLTKKLALSSAQATVVNDCVRAITVRKRPASVRRIPLKILVRR